MSVYVIESENGLVKIGEARNPRYRFSQIQACSPVQLRLVAILKDESECSLHKLFAQYRRNNEWFESTGLLWFWVEAARGTGLDDPVTDWVKDWSVYRSTKKDQHRASLRAAWAARRESMGAAQ